LNDIPESTKILVNKTGKNAEQGNSMIVTIVAKIITAHINNRRLVFSLNIFSILGTKRDIRLFELQIGPDLYAL
jgi:hypothetical protein